jgi:hypothetical protein
MKSEDDLIMEEAKRLRKDIMIGNKNYPEEMFLAFCVVLMDGTKKEYDEFIKDLDLDERDKLMILKGMLDKKVKHFWDDMENIVEFGERLLYEFNKELDKKRKKKKGKKK